jgi:hypothetical protein
LNIIEPLVSSGILSVRNRFPLPASLKQLEYVLEEEWHPLEIVQNLYGSSPRRIAAVLKAKYGPAPY